MKPYLALWGTKHRALLWFAEMQIAQQSISRMHNASRTLEIAKSPNTHVPQTITIQIIEALNTLDLSSLDPENDAR